VGRCRCGMGAVWNNRKGDESLSRCKLAGDSAFSQNVVSDTRKEIQTIFHDGTSIAVVVGLDRLVRGVNGRSE
jgi:uridylate kinase